jgi:protein tyrosine phosphatase (PTP) superfamily phosphohydrolase (DUF442 family)
VLAEPMTSLPISPHPHHGDAAPDRDGAPRPRRSSWRRRLARSILGLTGLVAIGNGAILAVSGLARSSAPGSAVAVPADVATIRNFAAVDATLWRGGAPGVEGYRALAAAGVVTVVDLRAEDDLDVPRDLLDDLGLSLVAIPMRDGQAPTPTQVQRFLDAVAESDGIVYLHCGAGVGRTGTMAAAYIVSRGGGAWGAVRANLAVGPPSLEQLAFAASLDGGSGHVSAPVVAVSRALDAPRRIWKVLEG